MENKLKILFVSSGNSTDFSISPFIKSQGDSLSEFGGEVHHFSIIGKGFKGYINSAKQLKKWVDENTVDIIHVHYALCAIPVILARTKKPIVVSLMGSDAYGIYINNNKIEFSSRILTLICFGIQPFSNAIISKSKNIDKYVYRRKIANIIPNGVNLNDFNCTNNKLELRKTLGLDPHKKYVLFFGRPSEVRKNYQLVEKSIALLKDPNVEMLAPYPVPHKDTVKYFNACDVFAMPAFMEGSPNVIKEAMSCNCPIVATNVGDVAWVIGDTEGCYISDFKPQNFANQLGKALEFSNKIDRTKGRKRIINLGIDTSSIAQKIMKIYFGVIPPKKLKS